MPWHYFLQQLDPPPFLKAKAAPPTRNEKRRAQVQKQVDATKKNLLKIVLAGPVTTKLLVELSGITKTTVQRYCQELEFNGLIQIIKDRKNNNTLTYSPPMKGNKK